MGHPAELVRHKQLRANLVITFLPSPDEQNLLTQDSHGVFYDAEVNQPFIVPCKPTFPGVAVTLEKNQGDFVSSFIVCC